MFTPPFSFNYLASIHFVCFLLLSACSTFSENEKPLTPALSTDGVKSNQQSMLITKRTYSATENLIEKSQVVIDRGKPLLVTSIVNVNKLEESSGPGRMITEQISGRIVQLGYTTIEPKLRNSLSIQGSGELILSRDVKLLKANYPAQAVVSGTYAIGSEQVHINLKLIELSESRILSSVDYVIPSNEWFIL